MNRYLLIYRRSDGQLLSNTEFESARKALQARLAAETEYSNDPDVEVVVLTSDSAENLRRTHSRYFGMPSAS